MQYLITTGFGALEGTRTPDPLLRRQLLYPTELQAHNALERVMGIEPTQPAWKAGILPLNYTRDFQQNELYQIASDLSSVLGKKISAK